MTTGIQWTDEVWNPVIGCTRVSAGCEHCYAERMAARLASNPKTPEYAGVAEFRGGKPKWLSVKTLPERLDQPLCWKRPRRVFVNSMSDLFHDDVPDEFIAAVFETMAQCSWHTFQVLTKRPARMLRFCTSSASVYIARAPLPNVHLGVSVEDQATADERSPLLFQTPAAVRWVSCEPMLGPIDSRCLHDGSWHDAEGATPALNWVVAGGESGPDARPMHSDWVRSLRDRCVEARVPFFFKQWSEANHGRPPGNVLDGVVWEQFPGSAT